LKAILLLMMAHRHGCGTSLGANLNGKMIIR